MRFKVRLIAPTTARGRVGILSRFLRELPAQQEQGGVADEQAARSDDYQNDVADRIHEANVDLVAPGSPLSRKDASDASLHGSDGATPVPPDDEARRAVEVEDGKSGADDNFARHVLIALLAVATAAAACRFCPSLKPDVRTALGTCLLSVGGLLAIGPLVEAVASDLGTYLASALAPVVMLVLYIKIAFLHRGFGALILTIAIGEILFLGSAFGLRKLGARFTGKRVQSVCAISSAVCIVVGTIFVLNPLGS